MRDYRALSELHVWQDNPRSIEKVDFNRLRKQIERLGQYKPLLVMADGTVLGGNMRLEALKSLGIDKAWVSTVEFKEEGKQWFAYVNGEKQKDPFDNKKQAMVEYALSDNDRAGSWVEQDLAELISNTPKLDTSAYKFDLGRLTSIRELMSRYGPDMVDEEYDEEPPETPKSKLGDVFQLGRHRLMCGDAIKSGDVEKLMDGKKADMVFTDPPYNVDYQGGMHADGTQTKRKKILNDKMTDAQFYEFLHSALLNMVKFTKGAFYVCMSSSELDTLHKAFEDAGGHWQTYIVWVKDQFTLSRADDDNQHEPILYGLSDGEVKKIQDEKGNFDYMPILYGWSDHEWYGGRKQGNVWMFDRPRVSKFHPTMKPVELCVRAIRNSSLIDQSVLDLFGGSGSTLIAAERTDRVCYMMELDPGYVDVIIRRWEALTGKKAERI